MTEKLPLVPDLQNALKLLVATIHSCEDETISVEESQQIAARVIYKALKSPLLTEAIKEFYLTFLPQPRKAEDLTAQREVVIPPESQSSQAIQHSQPASNQQ